MSKDSGSKIVRWSDDPNGLSAEECARRGIEAVAGLVISADIFRTNSYPDAHFCACAELQRVVTGTTGNFDDYIGVTFRVVEIVDGTYPLLGQESVRMVIQPLSDGSVSASWNAIDPAPSAVSLPGEELLSGNLDAHSRVCIPLALGPIAEQEEADAGSPSFLILKDPGAGWQIWRRSLHITGGVKPGGKDGFREESYAMVYPLVSPDMNWRFRVYDVPGGGIRWEVNSSNRR